MKMRLVIMDKEKHIVRINRFFKWLLYMAGYTIVFIFVGSFFKSFYIDTTHNYFFYPVVAVLIIYFLNQTIKPALVTLTIPITGITLGLFYPFINLFILKLTDWILGSHFQLYDTFIALFIAILLSIMNFLMEELVIKQIIKKVKRHE